jgi:hypothetical protein
MSSRIKLLCSGSWDFAAANRGETGARRETAAAYLIETIERTVFPTMSLTVGIGNSMAHRWRFAIPSLYRQIDDSISKLFSVLADPSDPQLLNGLAHSPVLRNQNHTGRFPAIEKTIEMRWHGLEVMRNEDAIQLCRQSKDLGILHRFRYDSLRSGEISGRLHLSETANDRETEIGVG